MKRRRWDSKTKTKIVLEGLSGRPERYVTNTEYIKTNTTSGGINSYPKLIKHLILRKILVK